MDKHVIFVDFQRTYNWRRRDCLVCLIIKWNANTKQTDQVNQNDNREDQQLSHGHQYTITTSTEIHYLRGKEPQKGFPVLKVATFRQ